MNFLEALTHRKPMRRTGWIKHPPVGSKHEDAARELFDSIWIYLREGRR